MENLLEKAKEDTDEKSDSGVSSFASEEQDFALNSLGR
jgi:hypothetical protein